MAWGRVIPPQGLSKGEVMEDKIEGGIPFWVGLRRGIASTSSATLPKPDLISRSRY